MKKYIGLLVFLGVLIAFPVKAQEAIFGFSDGKYYDQSGTLKYFCFMDKNCFDAGGKVVDLSAVLGVVPLPSYTQATYNPYPETPTPVVQNPTPQTTSMSGDNPIYTQVDIKTLISYTINSGSTTIGIYDPNYQYLKKNSTLSKVGDIFTVTFEGKDYTKTFTGSNYLSFTFGNVGNADNGGSLGVQGVALSPATSYSFTLRVERGNIYGTTTGTITTLSN